MRARPSPWRTLSTFALLASLGLFTRVPATYAGPPAFWHELGSPEDDHHCGAWDSARDRFVIVRWNHGYTPGGVYAYNFSGTPGWKCLLTLGPTPPPRENATMLYDSRRDRMVLYGGSNSDTTPTDSSVWVLEFSSTLPVWEILPVEGPGPGPMTKHAAILDAVDDCMIVAGSGTNGTWKLTLGTPARWSPVIASGTPPPVRFDHTAIYDADHQRMIVFGGSSPFSNSPLSDVWSLSLAGAPVWTQVTPTAGPPYGGRAQHAAVFDSRHHRMVVTGGKSQFNAIESDTWELSLVPGGETWSLITATNPAYRLEFPAAYDSLRDRLVVHGGQVNDTRNDLAVLPLGGDFTWSTIAPQVPGAPSRPGIAIDPSRQRIWLYAGTTLWTMALDADPEWEIVATTNAPNVTSGEVLVRDPVRDRLLLIGGSIGGAMQVWAVDLGGAHTWTQLATSGTPPTGVLDPAAIYDPNGDRLVIFGGYTVFNGSVDQTMALSLAGSPSWTPLAAPGLRPSARFGASFAYDSQRQRLLVHGGENGPGNTYADTWALALTGSPTWTSIADAAFPGANRPGCYDPVRDRFVVDSHALPLGGTTWSDLATTGSGPYWAGCGVYDAVGDRLIGPGAGPTNPWALEFGHTEGLAVPADLNASAAGVQIRAIEPNPASDCFRVRFEPPAVRALRVELLDLAGRRVGGLPLGAIPAGARAVTLRRPAGLPAGVYLVRVSSDGRAATRKVALLH